MYIIFLAISLITITVMNVSDLAYAYDEIIPEIVQEVSVSDMTSLALHLVNKKREEAGLPLLKLDKNLIALAEKYAKTMADTDTATHYVGGQTPRERAIGFGIELSDNFQKNNFTENIAYGLYSCLFGCKYTPESELRSRVDWFVSEKSYNGPHYRTIYHTDFNALGIGVVFVPESNMKGKFFISWEYAMLDEVDLPDVMFDISKDMKTYTGIMSLYNQEIINGYENGFFKPYGELSRVELLKVILKKYKIFIEKNLSVSYSDVSKENWYYDYVATATKRGIIDGYNDNTFRPDSKVSKVEALKMLFQTIDIDTTTDKYITFKDVEYDDWFNSYIVYAYDNQLMDFHSMTFGVDNKISRQDFCELLFRL